MTSLEVPCPRCSATAGHVCVRPNGHVAAYTHMARHEAAWRQHGIDPIDMG